MITTGQSGVEITHGMSVFGHLRRDPERAARFHATMSERTAAFAPSLAAGYDFAGLGTVADIGGGQGILLAAILRAHPHLRGILFELPEVAGGAAGVLEAAGVADRCEIVTGDFFESVPAGADACVMANVLHDWDDAQSVGILARCRQAMDGGGRVLIVERLIPQDPAAAVPVLISDLNMLVVTGGKERTNEEYGELLAAAGLNQGRIIPVGSPYGIIEGLVP